MSREKFQEMASARSLDPATISILIAESCEDEESLSRLTSEKLKSLDITEEQRGILEKWLAELSTGKKSDCDVGSKVTSESANAADEGINKTEQDYEEPGTPKPSRYEKCINVAIVGSDGEAKAALVNLVREVDPEHEDAAKSDSKDPVPYRFSKIENMLLWLMPTCEKGDEEALKRVEFHSYDAVVVCCSGTPDEGATWLITEARKGHAKTFLVKTDTDGDVDADRSANGDSHDEKALLEKLRSDIAGKLGASGDVQVFLVSTKRQYENQWDMPTLVNAICEVRKAEGKATANKDQAAGADKGTRADDSTEKGKIEKMAATFLSQVKDVVSRAAKKGNVGVLQKELAKYKKSFGVEKLELPSVNIDSLEEAVHQLMPDKKKLKDTFMACLGGRSKGAQLREAKQKVRDTIEDEGPTLMENAINVCKTAALEQLTKEAL